MKEQQETDLNDQVKGVRPEKLYPLK